MHFNDAIINTIASRLPLLTAIPLATRAQESGSNKISADQAVKIQSKWAKAHINYNGARNEIF